MNRRDRERGAAAVEFALVMPLLVLLVMGTVEFGRAYQAQTSLSGAARAGVRVMALQDDPDAAKEATEDALFGLDVTDAHISVEPSTCAVTGSTPPLTAVVTVTYPITFFTHQFGVDVTLTGKGSMRCNG